MDVETTEMKAGLDKPSNTLIIGTTAVSVLLSLMFLRKNPMVATFIGLWPPTILGLAGFMKGNKVLEQQRRMPAY